MIVLYLKAFVQKHLFTSKFLYERFVWNMLMKSTARNKWSNDNMFHAVGENPHGFELIVPYAKSLLV